MAVQMNVIDVVRRLDDAVCQAEADDEILEVRRRNHHHGLIEPVIGDRQRAFLGEVDDAPFGLVDRLIVIALAGTAGRWRGRCDTGGQTGRRVHRQARKGRFQGRRSGNCAASADQVAGSR